MRGVYRPCVGGRLRVVQAVLVCWVGVLILSWVCLLRWRACVCGNDGLVCFQWGFVSLCCGVTGVLIRLIFFWLLSY